MRVTRCAKRLSVSLGNFSEREKGRRKLLHPVCRGVPPNYRPLAARAPVWCPARGRNASRLPPGEETSHSHMKSQVWCSINPAKVPRGVREAPPARVTPLWRHAKVGRNTSASLTSLRVSVLCCEWITRFVKEFVPRISCIIVLSSKVLLNIVWPHHVGDYRGCMRIFCLCERLCRKTKSMLLCIPTVAFTTVLCHMTVCLYFLLSLSLFSCWDVIFKQNADLSCFLSALPSLSLPAGS